MRRLLLKALIAIALPPYTALVKARTVRNSGLTDNRLLGTWRSDKERTLSHWQFKDGIDPRAKETISSWFGKLTHTFTHSKVVTSFEGSRFESRYRVLAKTDNSSTIEYTNEGRTEAETVYFADGYLFKRVGTSTNFEYFAKIAA